MKKIKLKEITLDDIPNEVDRIMKSKTYKAIWLTEDLATKVKLEATKKKQTIIQFIEELIYGSNILPTKTGK